MHKQHIFNRTESVEISAHRRISRRIHLLPDVRIRRKLVHVINQVDTITVSIATMHKDGGSDCGKAMSRSCTWASSAHVHNGPHGAVCVERQQVVM